MRSEKEMLDLILGFAASDERVRAVYINGSMSNPDIKKDPYMDFDVVYVVTEKESFEKNGRWVEAFGDIAIVQEPCSNDFAWNTPPSDEFYNWLVLYKDGNRIDMTVVRLEFAVKHYLSDSLCVKLLDKDGVLPDIATSNTSIYHIKKPTEAQYKACCNEFWWCLNNVAKGLVRRQLPYAHRMYHQIVHTELEKVIEWYIGTNNCFSVTSGMWGKYFQQYLSQNVYENFLKTYARCDVNELWNAVFEACKLFREIALQVGEFCGYKYNESDETGILDYLRTMYGLSEKNN